MRQILKPINSATDDTETIPVTTKSKTLVSNVDCPLNGVTISQCVTGVYHQCTGGGAPAAEHHNKENYYGVNLDRRRTSTCLLKYNVTMSDGVNKSNVTNITTSTITGTTASTPLPTATSTTATTTTAAINPTAVTMKLLNNTMDAISGQWSMCTVLRPLHNIRHWLALVLSSANGVRMYSTLTSQLCARRQMSDSVVHAIVAVIGMICFVNSLSGDFVHDDIPAVVQNPDVLGTSTLAQLFSHDFWGQPMAHPDSHKSYRPITTLTFRYVSPLCTSHKKKRKCIPIPHHKPEH